MVIIVFGLPGSGKSYFAAKLAMLLDADYLNSDRIRKELFRIRTYSKKEKDAVYREMMRRLTDAVKQEKHVVLDATFHRDETRQLLLKEIEGKAAVKFIELWADEKTTRERLSKERPYSEADYGVYLTLKKAQEPLPITHLVLKSGDDDCNGRLMKALDYLAISNDNRTNT